MDWLWAFLVAALAAAIGTGAALLLEPVVRIDPALLTILAGLLFAVLLRRPRRIETAMPKFLKTTLEAGVILVGTQVNLLFLLDVGPRALLLVLAVVPLTLAGLVLMARAVRMPGHLGILLGFGTAICGVSAIAAAGATLRSKEEDIAVSVTAVGLLSAVGVLLLPALGLALALPPAVYGVWAGLSIHAVPNAIAAGFALGDEAGHVATLVKLARIALLAPLLVLAALWLRRHGTEAGERRAPLVPLPVWGFLVAVLAASVAPLPPDSTPALLLKDGTKLTLLVAMGAIGYSVRLGHVQRAGLHGVVVAVCGWVLLGSVALAGAVWAFG